MTPKELSDLAHNAFERKDTPRIFVPVNCGDVFVASICFTPNYKGEWEATVDNELMEEIVKYFAESKK